MLVSDTNMFLPITIILVVIIGARENKDYYRTQSES